MKIAKITLAKNESKNKYSSCTVYIVLMIVISTIFTGITIYFVYYNKKCLWLKMFLALYLVLTKKQKFGESNYIEQINGRNKANKY